MLVSVLHSFLYLKCMYAMSSCWFADTWRKGGSFKLRKERGVVWLQGEGGVYFAGAWCGYGFHEDGIRAAVTAVEAMGEWQGCLMRTATRMQSLNLSWMMDNCGASCCTLALPIAPGF